MTASENLLAEIESNRRHGMTVDEAIRVAHGPASVDQVAADMRVTVKLTEIRSRLTDLKTAMTFCGARLSPGQRERLQKAREQIDALLEIDHVA